MDVYTYTYAYTHTHDCFACIVLSSYGVSVSKGTLHAEYQYVSLYSHIHIYTNIQCR